MNKLKNPVNDALFEAFLKLETLEECYAFLKIFVLLKRLMQWEQDLKQQNF